MAYTTIDKSSLHFNTKTYTGNTAGQSITGIGFKADFSWFKGRVGGGYDHSLRDVIRGSLKHISSNAATAESDSANSVLSFDTDGFTLGTDNRSFVNENGTSMVSWNWKANGQGSSNTDGSINTTYTSVNTISGFSISTYTGTGSNATVGHGLGAVPKMIMVKKTSGSESWGVYHHSIGNTKFLQLNATGAEGTSSAFWNNTTPTSSVFSIGTENGVNQSGQTYIAYCFAEKTGFSKFGSYTGNGNADGSFIYTGFKPAFVLVKETGTGNWIIKDNKRPIYNQNDTYLFANTSDAESSASTLGMDLLSNGFKLRGTAGDMNGSGTEIIYMAFAEAPLVGSNNVPATAR